MFKKIFVSSILIQKCQRHNNKYIFYSTFDQVYSIRINVLMSINRSIDKNSTDSGNCQLGT